MDQRSASQAIEGLLGPTAMADEVALDQRAGAEEEDSGGVRAKEEAASGSLPRYQGRVSLRVAGNSLLHGSL